MAKKKWYHDLPKVTRDPRLAPKAASFNTGLGNNGSLEVDMPTHVLNTNRGPRTIHEGEQVNVKSNGMFDVTPAHQVGGQRQLKQQQDLQGIQGYQTGTPPDWVQDATKGVTSVDRTDQPPTTMAGVGEFKDKGVPDFITSDLEKNAVGHPGADVRSGVASLPESMLSEVPRTGGGLANETATNQGFFEPPTSSIDDKPPVLKPFLGTDISNRDISLGGAKMPTVDDKTGLGTDPAIKGTTLSFGGAKMPDLPEEESGLAKGTETILEEKFVGFGKPDTGEGAPGMEELKEPQAESIPKDALVEDVPEVVNYLDEAQKMMYDWASGNSEAMKTLSNIALQGFDARSAVEYTKNMMNIANNPNLTDGQKNAGMAMLARDISANRAILQSDMTAMAIDRAFQATGQMGDLALSAQRFELDEQQYGDTEKWRQYTAALEAEDYDTAGNVYEEITGKRLDTTQLQQARDYRNTKQEIEIEAGQIANRASELGIDINQWNLTESMIKSGNKQQAVDNLVASGKTPEEARDIVDGVYDTTVKRGWGLEKAQIALGTGDLEGYAEALGEIGIDIDISRLKTAQEQADFGEGMALLTSGLAFTGDVNKDGSTFDEAVSGGFIDLDMLGLTEEEAKKTWDSMQLAADPFYQFASTFEDDSLVDMFPEYYEGAMADGMTKGQAVESIRGLIGRASVFGAMTFDENGNFVPDVGLLTDIFGGDWMEDLSGDDASKAYPDLGITEQWNVFNTEQQKLPDDQRVSFETWKDIANRPETYDDYIAGVGMDGQPVESIGGTATSIDGIIEKTTDNLEEIAVLGGGYIYPEKKYKQSAEGVNVTGTPNVNKTELASIVGELKNNNAAVSDAYLVQPHLQTAIDSNIKWNDEYEQYFSSGYNALPNYNNFELAHQSVGKVFKLPAGPGDTGGEYDYYLITDADNTKFRDRAYIDAHLINDDGTLSDTKTHSFKIDLS